MHSQVLIIHTYTIRKLNYMERNKHHTQKYYMKIA